MFLNKYPSIWIVHTNVATRLRISRHQLLCSIYIFVGVVSIDTMLANLGIILLAASNKFTFSAEIYHYRLASKLFYAPRNAVHPKLWTEFQYMNICNSRRISLHKIVEVLPPHTVFWMSRYSKLKRHHSYDNNGHYTWMQRSTMPTLQKQWLIWGCIISIVLQSTNRTNQNMRGVAGTWTTRKIKNYYWREIFMKHISYLYIPLVTRLWFSGFLVTIIWENDWPQVFIPIMRMICRAINGIIQSARIIWQVRYLPGDSDHDTDPAYQRRVLPTSE